MLKNKTTHLAIAVLALCAAATAQAGTITGVRVDPPNVMAGGQVKVTVEGQDEGNCGLRVEYGTGDVDVTRMSAGKDNFPRSFMHTYNGAGTFTIIAKAGREGSTLGCSGEASTTVAVAPAPAPVPAPPPVMAAPACPDGFSLNRRSVNRRTGAYTCAAQPGVQLPPAGITCPPDTAYYTNTEGTMLGCKALRRR